MDPSELSSRKRPFPESESKTESEDEEKRYMADSSVNFDPRGYQVEIFKVALRRNTIAVLDTGAGKTMIAVMLMKEIRKEMKQTRDNRLIIFLAPTVHLVNQQYEVIRIHTNFKVGEYYGAKGIDGWTAQCWEKEINLHEEFYHNSGHKPKVFGMTASPVIRKGVSTAIDCETQLSELESILNSKICLAEDRTEIEECAPSAQEINWYYDPMVFHHEELKKKLECLWQKFDALVVHLQGSPTYQFKDTVESLKALRRDLENYHAKILYCLDNLGLTCAYEAAQVCMGTVHDTNSSDASEFFGAKSMQCKDFLQEASQIIEEYGQHDIFQADNDWSSAMKMGYLSPKLYELIHIFQSFDGPNHVLCLIFVERIITAKVIEQFMRRLCNLSHFTFSYLTGGNSSKGSQTPAMQKNILDLFRCGKVNLLFTTDVAEEGMDVHNCSCVIRFDLPKTVRSYIQSRGRARQRESRYILMLERGQIKQRELLFDIIRSELSMTDTALNRDPSISIADMYHPDMPSFYIVESTKATVTAGSSIGLIYKYCQKLPKDKYFLPKPVFVCDLDQGSYICTLTLPPNAAFKKIVGPPSKRSHTAKQLTCLEACKKLHQMGALDDHLLPVVQDPSENESKNSSKGFIVGAGTTKRKELHGTSTIHVLSGTWAQYPSSVMLWAYKLNFSCDRDNYSDFVLLLEANLEDDVAGVEVNLYLVNKVVKTSVSPCGQVQFDANQVKIAKRFHELLFNGLFGKLFVGSKSSGLDREFLLKTENNLLWNSSNMYILLPLDTSCNEKLAFNWKGICSCASAVEFFNSFSSHMRTFYSISNVADIDNKSDIIHLANKSVQSNNLKQMVVLAIHTGRIYSILDVVIGTSAETPFESDGKVSEFSSYREYFSKKYAIELQHPQQPLLLLKQSHHAHNLLSSNLNNEDGAICKKQKGSKNHMQVPKQQSHVHMPPELLFCIDVSIDVLKSFYLLPSLMHRLESLMLACQLREEIACHPHNSHIPASLILEAITTERCCEDFSLERMELLGDSVLKYAVSCHLFLKYPEKNEGELSSLRQWAVCNSTLHKLGTIHKLQGYIRDSAFEVRRWTAPGQLGIFPSGCGCGIDTREVPLENPFTSEDISIIVGKPCDKGHRWMCSKTIADCVEALIGAYYVGGGLSAALSLMKWFGVDVEFDQHMVAKAIKNAERWCYEPKADDVRALELKLGYSFETKGLLLEAMTHASQQELGAGYCYQRLEFLGDSALDVLITRHLFETHTEVDPGELTDLRAASVNNEIFAQTAVKHNLQQHLQHASGFMLGQITEYVKSLTGNQDNRSQYLPQGGGSKGPKALADLVESIAGAVLIDTGVDLEAIWQVFKPLLLPIVTPESLELAPFRELDELCSHHGYFISTKCLSMGDAVVAELQVQLKDELLTRQGQDRSRKTAKSKAAQLLLKDLGERRILHTRFAFKKKHSEDKLGDNSFTSTKDSETKRLSSTKKQKIAENLSISDLELKPLLSERSCNSVSTSVNMVKGGPRIALYELCKRLQYPLPTFKSTEHRSRSLTVVSKGPDERKGFNSFISTVVLHRPNIEVIEVTGQQRADKRSSQDSAALVLLDELQKRGVCTIGGS
ncbi:endoribonuclease Dicer homolog 3a isoform X2 [Aristolochia californica]|uniref:endoribonuclease Dicer homolog 3a isoform X2 n=1 Tax=Aristolochia californica TaxID=171875 RepID=UPI0035D6532A